MIVDLTATTAAEINAALTRARHASGSPAVGMVLTLVIVTDERHHYDAVKAANEAAREHPSRILTVIARGGRGAPRLDAEVRVAGETGLGENVLMRLHGELAPHADSVVTPLLLPDAPVVTWWPAHAPPAPAADPLGRLAQRRITDAAAESRPLAALQARAAGYTPGDTDLAWTRTTPWRTVLAAALDQPTDPVRAAEVGAARGNPSAELLAAWLESRLGVSVARHVSRGPGVTSVRLETRRGEIALVRPDGRLATLTRTGSPDRTVALPRRPLSELVAEELRRLDPDEVYAETLRHVAVPVEDRRPVPSAARAGSSGTR